MASPDLPAVLCLSPGGLLDVDPTNLDEVHSLWAAFSRAKNCIANGERLEYLSWRLYSREIMARHRAGGHNPTTNPAPKTVAPQEVPSKVPELMPCTTNGDASDVEEEPRQLSRKNHNEAHYRRISSHQLKDLFEHPSDIKQLSHLRLQKLHSHPSHPQHSHQHQQPAQPAQSKSASASPAASRASSPTPSNSTLHASQSAVAVNAYTNKFGLEKAGPVHSRSSTSSLPRSRSELHQNTSSSMDPLRTVRGFTPSSISVSVHRNNSMYGPRPGSESPQITTSRWEKATLPRNKMFFIEGDDSDSDSGAEKDTEPKPKSKPKTAATPVVNDGEIHEAGPIVSEPSEPRQKPNENDDDDAWEDANASSFSENQNDEDEDVWDDVDESSAEETEEQIQKSAEEERKGMFAERDVPLKPLVKPSLLSTLFLNKPEKVSAAQLSRPRDTTSRNIQRPTRPLLHMPGHDDDAKAPTQEPGVPAPVDILLGAPLAGHMPIPVASPGTIRRDMLESELSKSLRDNIEQSKAFHVEQMFKSHHRRHQSQNQNHNIPSSISSSTSTLKAPEREGRRSRRQSLVASAPTRSLSRPRSQHSSTASSGMGSSVDSRATSPMVPRNPITAPVMEYWPTNNRGRHNHQALAGERPDIPRRTTEPSVSSHSQQNLATNNTSWINRDEDIYDPLNYHSRGW